jgi:putative membrane protein
MKNLVLSLGINAASLFIGDYLIAGVSVPEGVSGLMTILIAAMVFGLLNYFVKPILKLLSLPLNILSFGLFNFVLNGIILLIIPHFVKNFQVDGLFVGIWMGVIVTISNTILQSLLKDNR